jgi:alpha-galactosidase
MREAMGADAFFLTCGTPILPAIGLCDAIRIGPDVSYFWETFRDASLLYNPTIPGTRNAIRTTLHRLWLKPLLHIDPDVAYFESKQNQLTQEQRILLRDLAQICEFKATSDLPQWLENDELEQLRSFLNTNPKIKQTSRYIFQIDDRTVDFTSATCLPDVPTGLTALLGRCVGWLGDRYFILRMYKVLHLSRLRKRRSNL